MNTPTLGYCSDTNISKREIAQTQLTEAITLFLSQKFICAITLAGAAEAVLAGLLTAQGQPTVVEESTNLIQSIREKTGLTIAEGKQKNEIYNTWNNARNQLKHHLKTENEYFALNLFDEAYWMITRAMENAKRLDMKIKNADDFQNWVIININM